jgi:hypothetical protein
MFGGNSVAKVEMWQISWKTHKVESQFLGSAYNCVSMQMRATK